MNVPEFVRESNRIEGIHRDPTLSEVQCLDAFIKLSEVAVGDLQGFVGINQPGAVLRDRHGLDVRVGNHLPPKGAPEIRTSLETILLNMEEDSPYITHIRYETLHPFTDGNGRSGRALWAWQMLDAGYAIELGFLHQFYYQALQGSRYE